MKFLLLGLSALSLVACSTQEPSAKPSGPAFNFTCAAEKNFIVRYDEGFTFAFVSAGGATYKLPAVISASGARYSDGKVEYWEHHGEAMLNGAAGGPYDGCKAR